MNMTEFHFLKKILFIIIIAVPHAMYADGAKDYSIVKVQITLNNNIQIVRNIPFNFDSLSFSDAFLFQELLVQHDNDSIYTYEDFLVYSFPNKYDSSQIFQAIGLYNLDVISVTDVKQIKHLKAFRTDGSFSIFTNHIEKDTSWTEKPIVRSLETSSFNCSFRIFQFEKSPFLDSWILDFIDLCGKLNGGFDFEEKLEKKVREISNKKIVIVASCTC